MKSFILLLALLLPFSCYAQEQCTLTPEQAPSLRTLKLGMSFDDFKRTIPSELSSTKNQYGERREYLTRLELIGNKEFEGIETAKVDFLDDKIVAIEIDYDRTYQWHSESEFIDKISELLNLPRKAWKSALLGKAMTCDGFKITAYTLIDFGSTHASKITIARLDTESIVKKRREEREEKERKTFRP